MSRSRLIGDLELRKFLRDFHKTAENDIKPAIQKGAEKILADMRNNVPKDSGKSSEALTAFVAKSGLDAQVGLRGKRKQEKFFYLYFIEFGTKGVSGERQNDGSPRSKRLKTDGSRYFGRYPDLPAHAAHPFVRPALDMNKDFVRELIRNAIRSTLERAAAQGKPFTRKNHQ